MIKKRDSRSLWQARKTRNKAFRKRRYFSCTTIKDILASIYSDVYAEALNRTKSNKLKFLKRMFNYNKKYVMKEIYSKFVIKTSYSL